MKRENFSSRLGFLLVSAGCAIGIGNVWRFPTVAGKYGGGVFVLFYLLFLAAMGIPVLTMELAVGRAGRGSAGAAYRALEPKGSRWHLHGWACLLGSLLLMMYYTTVSGWMVSYFVKFAAGRFAHASAQDTAAVFAALLANPATPASLIDDLYAMELQRIALNMQISLLHTLGRQAQECASKAAQAEAAYLRRAHGHAAAVPPTTKESP